MEKVSVVGVDLAKNVFEVTGRNEQGRTVIQRSLRREKFREFIFQLPPTVIGMEACGGAHHWGRVLRGMGHEVRLVSPQFVKPYVKSNKNDRADSEAICEAVTRPHMRFVAVKSLEQQDVLSVHRVRERLIKNRTALCNEIRGLLGEYGRVVAQGVSTLRRMLPRLLEEAENGLTDRMRELIGNLWEELKELEERIARYNTKIEIEVRTNEVCQRLKEVPGVGSLTASAVVASVGNPNVFKNGREFSASLGLVPRQHSSGGKDRLLGISKRGDKYLRRLLIHGARAVLRHLGSKEDPRSEWLRKLEARRGKNRACVALANKNARILWVLMARGEKYLAKTA
ncbi:MAG TPA: IS110 family transposase [Bdellovibrionota bacterium]|nr:IS110 family transposase [Bdellovibrionota bacterium]